MKQVFFLLSIFFIFGISGVNAAQLMSVSDTITDSAPSSVTSNHTIQFTASTTIPAGGSIILTPEAGYFTIPAGLDYTDIDFAIATSGGNFIERTLGTIAGTSTDAVSVIAGTAGSITITLNSTQGASSTERLRVKIGTNAVFDFVGDQRIINPSSVRSYRVNIKTRDSGFSLLDEGDAMIAVVLPVTAGPAIPLVFDPPVRFNGLPVGLLPSGTQNVEMSLQTNEIATCKYSLLPNIPYASSTDFFIQTFALTHTVVISGLQDGQSYDFYVRCIDFQGNDNPDDFQISFQIGVVPGPPGDGGSGGGSGGGRGPGVGNGEGGNFLGKASVTIAGKAYPGSTLTLLQDGVKLWNFSADGLGLFTSTVTDLERGTYTFSVYAFDPQGKKSVTYSSTIFIISRTGNIVTRAILPPTLSLSKPTVEIGEPLGVFGYSAPGSSVEVVAKKQFGFGVKSVSTTSVSIAQNGAWSALLQTANLERGTYELRARTIFSDSQPSDFSPIIFVGIGEDASPDFSLRADLNKDGKVNLVDFSILLFNWNTNDPIADINIDGTVNIADFSIMIFYWTG